jgi:uncharacterized pyridoxal phosphate-containing UPF0001 family protein
MTGTKQETVDRARELIDGIARDLAETVQRIEAKTATTRNRYGDYMAVIGTLADNKAKATFIALALVKAGANRQGVSDAMRVMYG